MYRFFLLLLCLTMVCATAAGQRRGPVWHKVEIDSLMLAPANEGPWQLVWHDEFADSVLNATLWEAVTGIPRDFGLKHQRAWHTPQNVVVRGGRLFIVSRREQREGMVYPTGWEPLTTDTADFGYTTGEVWSRRLFGYGKYEAKIRLPRGYGLWPAFWLFSPDPHQDEIDIFELWNETGDRTSRRRLSTVLHHALHYDYDSLHPGVEQKTHSYWGEDYYSRPHIYTLVYTPYSIRWLVDGEELWCYPHYRDLLGNSLRRGDMRVGQRCVENRLYPCHPLHLILNVAIQTGEDAPDETTPFPTEMEVDWVRYYRSGD